MENTLLILLSGGNPQEAMIAEIAHSRLGGSLAHVDAQRKPSEPTDPHVTRFHSDQLDQLYCKLAVAQGPATVVVSARAVPATIKFLERYPGTVNDFSSVICFATPDSGSQQRVADRLTSLAHMGADHNSLAVAFTNAPRAARVEDAYKQLADHVASGNFSGVSLDAVLYRSTLFERIRDLQLPLGEMLRGEVDYQTSLKLAHRNGEPEHVLHRLAQQVMVQAESLLAARPKSPGRLMPCAYPICPRATGRFRCRWRRFHAHRNRPHLRMSSRLGRPSGPDRRWCRAGRHVHGRMTGKSEIHPAQINETPI